jgi:hypothetical protein
MLSDESAGKENKRKEKQRPVYRLMLKPVSIEKAKAPGPKRSKVVLEGPSDKRPLNIALMKIFLSNGERPITNGTH